MTDKEWSGQIIGGRDYCEVCGKTLVHLAPHHYIYRSQCLALRHEIRNGICICPECHNKAHKDRKWIGDWMQKNRPADKKFCDNRYLEDNKIGGKL